MKKLNILTITSVISLLLFAMFLSSPTTYAATTTTKYLNGKIVFWSDQDDPNGEIYTMNADGSNLLRLTSNPAYEDEARWSPDGSKIAFYSDQDDPNYEIYTMNADGSNLLRLTSNSVEDSYPVWSPDGSKIGFSSFRDGNREGYVMDANGSNPVNLTNNPGNDYIDSWSPDGSKLSFETRRDGNFEVYTMDANGSNQTRLTNNSADDYESAWSRDGSKIAFNTSRDGNFEIYVMDVNGVNPVNLTNNPAHETGVSWSPDGKSLLFGSRRDGNSQIYSMNLDGSNQTRLNSTTSNDYITFSQSWQPLPYTVTTQDDGSITSVIAAGDDYSSTDYTVAANETLVLDGTLCDVTVQSGGTLMGDGSIAPDCTLHVEPGGILAPGHSPGCLASGNTTISGTYQAELAGTTACTQYDQLQVTGTVTLTNATLTPSLLNSFVPKAGDSFTIIQNDATDPVTGTFANLSEGATVTVGSSILKISYVGGDGNDVTLTAQTIPGAPETGMGRDISLRSTFAIAGTFVFSALVIFASVLKKGTIGKRSYGK